MGCSPPHAGRGLAGGARGTRRGEPALRIHPLDLLSLRADGAASISETAAEAAATVKVWVPLSGLSLRRPVRRRGCGCGSRAGLCGLCWLYGRTRSKRLEKHGVWQSRRDFRSRSELYKGTDQFDLTRSDSDVETPFTPTQTRGRSAATQPHNDYARGARRSRP